MEQLIATWPKTVDAQEKTRRLIDLFLLSVLLDAGAGTRWSYKSKESGKVYKRSEGLAIASLEMFKAGYFSSDTQEPSQVDSLGLKRLSVQQLAKGLQVTEYNPIAGLEGRAGLLSRLGDALKNSALFGAEGRPGHMLGITSISISLDHTDSLEQTISSLILPHKPHPSLSSQSPPSGQSSSTVSQVSGPQHGHRSMVSHSAMLGPVLPCLNRPRVSHGSLLFPSTNSRNGSATP